MSGFFLAPWFDFRDAMERALAGPAWRALPGMLLGLAVSWWVYVPVHELLHALGCLATGGSVWRLEISPEYGAALLKRIFPFVSVGSRYAGQLTGFDTRGNDLIYLSTVYAPFLLSIFVGVPLLRAVGRGRSAGPASSVLAGVALLLAYMPFANLVGDFYELGSIPVSRLAATFGTLDPARWRSDDLIKLAGELWKRDGFRTGDGIGLASGFALGVLSAFATYWLGRRVSRWFEGPHEPRPSIRA